MAEERKTKLQWRHLTVLVWWVVLGIFFFVATILLAE